MLGTVKWFDPRRGYGFIERDDGRNDVFVHEADVTAEKSLSGGERVRFRIERGAKGPRAVDVKLAGSDPKPKKPSQSRRGVRTRRERGVSYSSFTYTIYSRGYDGTSSYASEEGDTSHDQRRSEAAAPAGELTRGGSAATNSKVKGEHDDSREQRG